MSRPTLTICRRVGWWNREKSGCNKQIHYSNCPRHCREPPIQWSAAGHLHSTPILHCIVLHFKALSGIAKHWFTLTFTEITFHYDTLHVICFQLLVTLHPQKDIKQAPNKKYAQNVFLLHHSYIAVLWVANYSWEEFSGNIRAAKWAPRAVDIPERMPAEHLHQHCPPRTCQWEIFQGLPNKTRTLQLKMFMEKGQFCSWQIRENILKHIQVDSFLS